LKIEKATAEDLAFILHWLEQEYDDEGVGFWCNHSIIKRSLSDGDLWVIRDCDQAIAFQVGHYAGDIVNVRKDKQRQGLGTALFEGSLDRAIQDNINVLFGECSPGSSLPFWEKHGFKRYGDMSDCATIKVRRVLLRTFPLSEDLPCAAVSISFFPENALYKEDAPPVAVHNLQGRRRSDGVVLLGQRVIGFVSDVGRGDLIVKIDVDGFQLCFCKAKYKEAEDLGLVRDEAGECFYVDALRESTR
jgi:GNAT superfamily N-acetyltransferase